MSRAFRDMGTAGNRTVVRWLKFNLVGAIGIVVQLGVLAALTRVFGLNYLAGTALAVESAVLHNFIWHERFTWADRASVSLSAAAARLVRFNLTTGVVSIVGNLALMRVMVGQAHLPVIVASLLSVAACSLINFVVNDKVVFRPATVLRTKKRAAELIM